MTGPHIHSRPCAPFQGCLKTPSLALYQLMDTSQEPNFAPRLQPDMRMRDSGYYKVITPRGKLLSSSISAPQTMVISSHSASPWQSLSGQAGFSLPAFTGLPHFWRRPHLPSSLVLTLCAPSCGGEAYFLKTYHFLPIKPYLKQM